MNMKWHEVLALFGQAQWGEDPVVQRVVTDSRLLQAGDLFVALRGAQWDGHDFVKQAGERGAVGALVEQLQADVPLAQCVVPDTREGLGELAAHWRSGYTGPLVAVTGSNGKTTVTQMIARIWRAWLGDAAWSTQGNFNNEIGLPLTLLGLRPHEHRACVVELGMNHPGEIARLAQWARPTVALVNNAQREHQEFMGTVEAVARENGCVLQALNAQGVAVYPARDAHAAVWRQGSSHARSITFDVRSAEEPVCDADVQAVWAPAQAGAWGMSLTVTGWAPEPVQFTLPMLGAHNAHNAVAALVCAHAAGAPQAAILAGLTGFQAVRGRTACLHLRVQGQPVQLVDDTYNANPDSVAAAIAALSALKGPRALILGDMGEVGEQGPAFHADVGRLAAQAGVDRFWTVGDLMRHAHDAWLEAGGARDAAQHFEHLDELMAQAKRQGPWAATWVKGSRFMRMERVVAALKENHDVA